MYQLANPSVRWLILSLVAVSVTSGVAVSCAGIGSNCQFDSDCSGGNLCIRQTCYAACTSSEDCSPPYVTCQAYARQNTNGDETVKICVDADFEVGNNGIGEDCEQTGDCCQTDEECAALPDFGSDAVCGADNRCITPVARPKQGILIRDRTPVDTRVEPADGGLGADIAAVFVRPVGTEEPAGFGVALEYAPVNGADGALASHDGTAPTLSANGECVARSFNETALPLGGEGGYVLFGFENTDGRRLLLNNEWEVVVIEWGANCAAEASADAYDVFMCTAETDAIDLDEGTDCDTRLNTDPSTGFGVWSLDTRR